MTPQSLGLNINMITDELGVDLMNMFNWGFQKNKLLNDWYIH